MRPCSISRRYGASRARPWVSWPSRSPSHRVRATLLAGAASSPAASRRSWAMVCRASASVTSGHVVLLEVAAGICSNDARPLAHDPAIWFEETSDDRHFRPGPGTQRRQSSRRSRRCRSSSARPRSIRSGWRSCMAACAATGPRCTGVAGNWPVPWSRSGVGKGDTVAVMLPNTPAMVEAHFGVPMAGAVLNALNTRLDAPTIAFMLDHGEARVVLVDPEFAAVMQQAIALRQRTEPLLVIDVADAVFGPARRSAAVDVRRFPAPGRPGLRLAVARRRVGCDCAELHQRHHRQSQGRGLPPPRRSDQCDLQHPGMGHGQAPGLPVDLADVPLQRLVLSVDHRRTCRRQRVPAQGRAAGDLRRHARPWRHPLLRRAHRARHAGQCARRR